MATSVIVRPVGIGYGDHYSFTPYPTTDPPWTTNHLLIDEYTANDDDYISAGDGANVNYLIGIYGDVNTYLMLPIEIYGEHYHQYNINPVTMVAWEISDFYPSNNIVILNVATVFGGSYIDAYSCSVPTIPTNSTINWVKVWTRAKLTMGYAFVSQMYVEINYSEGHIATASLNLTGSVVRVLGHARTASATLTLTGSCSRSVFYPPIYRTASATLTLTGSVSRLSVMFRTITATLGLTGTSSRITTEYSRIKKTNWQDLRNIKRSNWREL